MRNPWGVYFDVAVWTLIATLRFSAMEHVEQLRRARLEFERRVAQIQVEHLALPTPCSDWTVRQLLAHVIGGGYRYVAMLHGSSAEQLTSVDVGQDPLKQFQRSADEVIAAFQEPGALQRTVRHPIGEIPAMQLLDMRATEWTVHGWDLARAIKADDALDTELAELLYARLVPRVDAWLGTGYFQPPKGLPDTAPSQDRLLDLLGRQP